MHTVVFSFLAVVSLLGPRSFDQYCIVCVHQPHLTFIVYCHATAYDDTRK